MASHIHMFKPGAAVTCAAGADITGGQVVAISGDREVSPAGAASTAVFGVAATDVKDGEDVLVLRGGVQELVASAAIAAGARVAAAAGGKVATATENTIGLAITAASAADDKLQIALD
ncbi:capsid cement protein [Serinibacter salmoneus]|uniref:Uncharacterized protein DUF2190 n=1 Tax=Serinibacter salmoneus TaxID=556530 RepID=A0A2A9CZK2_9MICO|nr:capsid cement protein [Serinibacter salmoneus]PFG19867.1 uncharacterized protein DUF2190 [Serinibacter salmoneus]